MFNKVALLVLVFTCFQAQALADSDLSQTVSEYYQVYSERKDFNQFMAFYAEDATLNDVVFGFKAANKTELRNFFDWSRGEFKLKEHGPILIVKEQVISGSTVITSGHFVPFVYNGNELGPWEFVIWHEFNEQGKIQSQQDWINYGPKKFLFGQSLQ